MRYRQLRSSAFGQRPLNLGHDSRHYLSPASRTNSETASGAACTDILHFCARVVVPACRSYRQVDACASPIFGPHESRALTGVFDNGSLALTRRGRPNCTGRENQNGGDPVPAKPSCPSLDGPGSGRIWTPVRGGGRRNVSTTMAGPCRSGRAFGGEGKEEGVVGLTETRGQRATAGTRTAPRLTTERSQTNVHGCRQRRRRSRHYMTSPASEGPGRRSGSRRMSARSATEPSVCSLHIARRSVRRR